MSTRAKVFLGLGIYVALIVATALIFGWSRNDNNEYQPQNEFKLDTWINLPGPFDINKAVVYVVVASALTVITMVYVARRMQQRPGRLQTTVELAFTLMRDNITQGNMDSRMAAKWFPFIATLFLFIWFSNMIGYLPLPTATEHKITILGLQVPSFALYAATANLSIPLVPRPRGVDLLQRRGRPGEGAGWLPQEPGPRRRDRGMAVFIFILEFFSNVMRLLSLSVRLFANILAGHLIILFMAGGWWCCWASRPSASSRSPRDHPVHLRSRPGGHAAGLHLRHAHRDLPRRRGVRRALTKGETSVDLAVITTLAQAAGTSNGADAGKAIALGLGGGLGAAGAGVGIGYIFGKVIESVTRQPEMRDEITSIQWLGFALTEACVFYGLVAGLLAFFL
jgi:F-type H+-transporting ATPase subunit a